MNHRLAFGAGAAGAVVVLAVAGPFVLRGIPFFRVRQVEVIGLRYLAVDRVVQALAFGPERNLFDPLDDARRRVRALPGIVSGEIDRRLPGTVRVTIVERTPAAFVSGREGMIVLDCAARPLPYEPTSGVLDLPLVARADSAVVRALCIVRASDSTLYQAVHWAHAGADGTITLDLGRERVVLRNLPTTDEIAAVAAVRRHLAAAGQWAGELDARFAGWVVARRSRT